MFPIYFWARHFGVNLWILEGLHNLSSIWMGFIIYFTLLAIIAQIVAKISHLQLPYFAIVLSLTIAILIFGYVKNSTFEIEKFDVEIEKPLPSNLKIIVLSDMHLGYGTTQKKLSNYVEKINAQNPDLILIAGDLIDDNLEVLYAKDFATSLRNLKAPLGIYAITGNHEYLSSRAEFTKFFEKSNIKLLRSHLETLPNGLQILGLDDFSNKSAPREEALAKLVDFSKPSILLDHQPYNLTQKAKLGFDMQFCGHTHKGQIFPVSLIPNLIFEMGYGYKKIENCHSFVSSGISLWGPPFRVGTQNEILVINLSSKKSQNN